MSTSFDRITEFRVNSRDWLPYLSGYVYQLDAHERPGLGTMAVDKQGRLYFDPKFADYITVENGSYVVLHEALHLFLRHCHRAVDIVGLNATAADYERLNKAFDLVIWELLENWAEHAPKFEDGGEPVTWHNMSAQYPKLQRNMDPETIYRIMEEQDNQPKPQPQPEPKQEPGQKPEPQQKPEPEGEQEDDCDGDASDEDNDGDGSRPGDAGDQDADGEGGGGDGEGDSQDGSSQGPGKPDSNGKPDPVRRIGGGSAADGLPRDYEEPENDNWDAFQERKMMEQVEEAIKEKEADPTWSPARGTQPLLDAIKDSIERKLRPQPDPWEALKACVSAAVKANKGCPVGTWQRSNRRQYSHPDAVRMKGSQPYSPRAVVIIDTSGSMTPLCKQKCFTVVAQGLRAVGEFHVICGDTRVQTAVKLNSLARLEIPLGGGTDMRPLIAHAEKEYKPDVIVIGTDGGTPWPAKPTKAKLIVALTQETPTPTWAVRCRIPDEGKVK